MTTTTDTVIVPPMYETTGVALWTPTGPRIIHTADDTGTRSALTRSHTPAVGSHTGPEPSHTEPEQSHGGSHTRPTPVTHPFPQSHRGSHTVTQPVPTGHTGDPTPSHTQSHTVTRVTEPLPRVTGNPSHTGSHTSPVGLELSHTSTGKSPVGLELSHTSTGKSPVGTPGGTHDDDTEGTVPMHIAEVHRTQVADLPTKADKIRHICAILGNPTTGEVQAWAQACEIKATPKYISRLVSEWRAKHGLEATGEFQIVTDADLAALSNQDAPEDEDDEETEVDGPAAAELDPELATRVRQAQARLPLQADPALYTALSDEEMDAERELAEKERETAREIRRRRMAADLARAKRDQATAEAISKSEASDARWLERARSKKRRLTSDDAKLAQLTRNSEWSARALVAAVALGMAWSAVNAQHNLVPSGDPLFWLSYGVEAMISLPLIVIMVAATSATRWGRKMSGDQKKKVVAVELALLATTLALNVGPHLFPSDGQAINPGEVFKFGIAPVMVGVLLQVHTWASDHYAGLLLAVGNDRPEGDR